MIRLTKGPIPPVLQQNADAWTRTLVDKLERGEIPAQVERTRYNHPDIKSAIVAETHGKCAYCESKIRHVAPGDIEHIAPKSKAPERTFEWENLTLACPECNRRKNNHGVDDGIVFVDPYAVDPANYLRFFGDLVLAVPGQDSGQVTEKLLELNRPELVERRRGRILNLQQILEAIARTHDLVVRQILIEDTRTNEMAASQEYAAASREFLRASLPDA